MERLFTPSVHIQRHQFVIDFVKRTKPKKVSLLALQRVYDHFDSVIAIVFTLTLTAALRCSSGGGLGLQRRLTPEEAQVPP